MILDWNLSMANLHRRPARVFPPGDFIRKEIEARGWTQGNLAKILDRPLQTVNTIINGEKAVTPEMAVGLAAAFGTSPEFWLNLEAAYALDSRRPTPDGTASPCSSGRSKTHADPT